MGEPKITVEMNAKEAALINALNSSTSAVGKLNDELNRVRGTTKSAKKDSDEWLDGFSKKMNIAHAAGSLLNNVLTGSKAAFAALLADFNAMIDAQKRAGSFQTSVAGAQRAALRNLGQSDLSPQQLQAQISGIASGTGADLTSLYQAASGVLSARGGFSAKQAISQLKATAQLDPSLPASELQTLSGSALDIGKAYGGTEQGRLGYMLAAQQQARVENTGQFGQNIVPALLGLKQGGTSDREAAALAAVLSQMSGDVTGAQSGTAVIQLDKQIAQATAGVPSLRGKGLAAQLAWLRSGGKESEAIRQGLVGNLDEAAQAAGFEKGELSIEAKQFRGAIGLLTPGSDAVKAYEGAYAAIPSVNEGGKFYQSAIDAQQLLGIQATGRVGEGFGGARQKIMADPRTGRIGKTWEELEGLLTDMDARGENIGANWLMKRQASVRYHAAVNQFGQEPEAAAASIARDLLTGVEGGRKDETNRNLAEALRELIAKLDVMAQNVGKVQDVNVVGDSTGIKQSALPSSPLVGNRNGGP